MIVPGEVGGPEKIVIITHLFSCAATVRMETLKERQTNDGLFVLCCFKRWEAGLGCHRWRNLT